MSKTILITGGARSGKSRFAERLAKDLKGPVLYIATAQAFDEEMKLRIKKHRESRPPEWATVESYHGLGKIISHQGNLYRGVLIDCLTIMVINLLLEIPAMQNGDIGSDSMENAEAVIMDEIKELSLGISRTDADVIIVTNELGSGIVPEYPLARIFRDIAGRVNQYMAEQADEVYLVVCGIPMRLK